ncbi:hypothetical protein [Streptomyces hokutonensis]|uniref:nuclear transport factor 2 family protein n=1 Tax=Streptomyces hokutonensis TaxID=1306990 RepID=UPI0036CDEA05
MQEYTIVGGVAQIHDPAFFDVWMYRDDFAEALSKSPTAEVTTMKRLVIEFEAALARMMLSGRVDEQVDGILEKFIVDDYIQNDPNVPGNGRAFLADGFRKIPLTGDAPPPPVALMVEGDLVSLLMQKPWPDPTAPGSTYDWFIPTVFRIKDGKLAEHWGSYKKGGHDAGPGPAPE